jgi:hypothetical protein
MVTMFLRFKLSISIFYGPIARLAAVSVGGEAPLDQIALDFRGDTMDESVCRSIGC